MKFDLEAVFARNRALYGNSRMEEGGEGGEGASSEGASSEGQQGKESEGELGDAGKKALDKIRAERDEARREAKANKEAAARLKTIEDEKLTAEERTAAKLAEADAKVAGVPALVSEALKAHLVAFHKIEGEDAELFLTASDPELLLKQVDRLVNGGKKGKGKGNYVPGEGSRPGPLRWGLLDP
jgi:hypothetical protein